MYTPDIIIDTIIDALGSFLQPFVGAAQIILARQNRVATPLDAYVLLTDILMVDLETPTRRDSVGVLSVTTPKRIDVQIDIYGSGSGDQCAAIKNIFRTSYACEQFPANIQPLYCSDGIAGVLVTGEEQYDSRWTLTASLQYNPTVTVPQQAADALAMNIIEDII